ncbi:hypothetical protein [Telluribacter sp. SYSU D00476]|uniref:hypothetical protein n=1 Tax=Telluribacter sp. SYSU D00476 TaxID=2811430 RepID=UPI001FF3DDC6|nr:hypothetical protein [Telluribacter sp. SYSU D00476]
MKKTILITGLLLPTLSFGHTGKESTEPDTQDTATQTEYHEVQSRAGIFKLETQMNTEGISYRFAPLSKTHTIEWDEVEKAYVREFKPLREYGGWGIRYSFSRGKAYFMKGNKGIQLELKNGKKVLLGTQNPAEAGQLLQHLEENGFIK